jgi:hypothetical protein
VLKFKQFILEDDSKLKHLTHVEDRLIDSGSKGYDVAVSHLYSVHDKLKGRRQGRSTTTVKKDGAPAVVFGYHPETHKFFVGTKSVWNKKPKINYSNEDIERNHGHAPGLVEKLKHSLHHLPKITPHGKVFQGDLMYSGSDVKDTGKHYTFKPNTIEYSAPKNSPHGKAISKAKLGISVHTEYKTDSGKLGDAAAHFNPDIHAFHKHDDVHLISHHYDFDNPHYEEQHSDSFTHHMNAAKESHASTKNSHYDLVTKHAPLMNIHINDRVREGKDDSISHSSFIDHMSHRAENHKSKTERVKAVEAVNDAKNNPEAFNSVLKTHRHLAKAKESLINVLNRRQTLGHSIDGRKANPEGYVDSINHKGGIIPSKFVNRSEFARANFSSGKPKA